MYVIYVKICVKICDICEAIVFKLFHNILCGHAVPMLVIDNLSESFLWKVYLETLIYSCDIVDDVYVNKYNCRY